MNNSIFLETEFFLLLLFSVLLPAIIYAAMMVRKAISRKTILLLAFVLIVLAGVDVFLLQRLAAMARLTASTLDDKFFLSEISLALYLLPLLSAGIGTNLLSYLLGKHLDDAEARFKRAHADD